MSLPPSADDPNLHAGPAADAEGAAAPASAPDDHTHDHVHCADAVPSSQADTRLKIALALTSSFMVVEVIGGWWSGSLALLADAGHMLTDALALSLALWARQQTRRPADALRSYGYHRMPVMAAFVNGLALLAMAAWIMIEAVRRLLAPSAVEGELMLGVAVAGLAVNLLSFWILRGAHVGHAHGHGAHDHDLNLRGAMLHVLGDLLGSVAAIAAALIILWSGWLPIDPLLSVIVALLILVSAWRLVSESGHVLLEGTPTDFDARAFAEALIAAIPQVSGVHHVHHWMLTPQRSVMTLHAVTQHDADPAQVIRAIQQWTATQYRVAHVTVQIEPNACVDAQALGHDCAPH